jgi:hypothetical protein
MPTVTACRMIVMIALTRRMARASMYMAAQSIRISMACRMVLTAARQRRLENASMRTAAHAEKRLSRICPPAG